MTTARLSRLAGVMRAADTISVWNAGVVPIDSAFDRYSVGSVRCPLSSRGATTSTDTGRLGVSTKWNTLSCGSGSVPARTVPRR